MSQIRGRDTRPELKLRKALWAMGLRYRLKSRLPGNPDLVFPSLQGIVFVDGCFWHGCPRHGTRPASNAEFWRNKLATNVARDKAVNRKLRRLGWRVVRVWEHDIIADSQKAAMRVYGRLINRSSRR